MAPNAAHAELSAAEEDIARIADYHAHVYHADDESRVRAARLRERASELFPKARLGRWHARIGPHTQPMYQIAFPRTLFATFVPWLMLNRDGLTILLHPNTGRPRDDHSAHAVWFGAVLPLALETLAETEDPSEHDDDR